MTDDSIESCGFCKSVVNEGATVCANCGAEKAVWVNKKSGKTYDRDSLINVARLGMICSGTGVAAFVIGVVTINVPVGLFGILVPIGLFPAIIYKLRSLRKPAWHRRAL